VKPRIDSVNNRLREARGFQNQDFSRYFYP
jgi:hypothetical protein